MICAFSSHSAHPQAISDQISTQLFYFRNFCKIKEFWFSALNVSHILGEDVDRRTLVTWAIQCNQVLFDLCNPGSLVGKRHFESATHWVNDHCAEKVWIRVQKSHYVLLHCHQLPIILLNWASRHLNGAVSIIKLLLMIAFYHFQNNGE